MILRELRTRPFKTTGLHRLDTEGHRRRRLSSEDARGNASVLGPRGALPKGCGCVDNSALPYTLQGFPRGPEGRDSPPKPILCSYRKTRFARESPGDSCQEDPTNPADSDHACGPLPDVLQSSRHAWKVLDVQKRGGDLACSSWHTLVTPSECPSSKVALPTQTLTPSFLNLSRGRITRI